MDTCPYRKRPPHKKQRSNRLNRGASSHDWRVMGVVGDAGNARQWLDPAHGVGSFRRLGGTGDTVGWLQRNISLGSPSRTEFSGWTRSFRYGQRWALPRRSSVKRRFASIPTLRPRPERSQTNVISLLNSRFYSPWTSTPAEKVLVAKTPLCTCRST